MLTATDQTMHCTVGPGFGHDGQLASRCAPAAICDLAPGTAHGKQSAGDAVPSPGLCHTIGEPISLIAPNLMTPKARQSMLRLVSACCELETFTEALFTSVSKMSRATGSILTMMDAP